MMDFFNKFKRMPNLVSCPKCQGDIAFKPLLKINGIIAEGTILCNENCGVIGYISQFKYFFNSIYRSISIDKNLTSIEGHVTIENIRHERFLTDTVDGFKKTESNHYYSENNGESISFFSKSPSLSFCFIKHSWSGIVNISINEKSAFNIDLFEETGSALIAHPIYLGEGEHFITIKNNGERNSNSIATQIYLKDIQELKINESLDRGIFYTPMNYGNSYPCEYFDLISTIGINGVILDCGSGDRCYPDQRIINFEYLNFRSPDVFGDGHHLPFKDNSFDVVFSQAVIEHLYDPFQAINEIHRVLKPEGKVYASSAFMQPMHAVPYHYFNTTIWGISELFKQFRDIKTFSSGNLAETLTWIYQTTDLRTKGHGKLIDDLISIAKILDLHITNDDLVKFSSFVTLLAKK